MKPRLCSQLGEPGRIRHQEERSPQSTDTKLPSAQTQQCPVLAIAFVISAPLPRQRCTDLAACRYFLPHQQPHYQGRSCHHRDDAKRCRERRGLCRRSAGSHCHGEHPKGRERLGERSFFQPSGRPNSLTELKATGSLPCSRAGSPIPRICSSGSQPHSWQPVPKRGGFAALQSSFKPELGGGADTRSWGHPGEEQGHAGGQRRLTQSTMRILLSFPFCCSCLAAMATELKKQNPLQRGSQSQLTL